ncbi:hypothetical protein [Paenibacillus alvei]|nr:hypothetical protein [Paenibacillus alvei]
MLLNKGFDDSTEQLAAKEQLNSEVYYKNFAVAYEAGTAPL